MRIEAYRRPSEMPPGFASQWNGLLAPDKVTHGVDVTATFEWNAALIESFLEPQGATLLVAEDSNGCVLGILPICRPPAPEGAERVGRIAFLPELYGGRYGLLLRERSEAVLHTLLERATQAMPDWECLELTLPEDSPDLAFIGNALKSQCLGMIQQPLERSPYICLPANFDDYFKTLRPNFRTEIRRGERRLGEQGRLRRRLFTSPDDVTPLWQAILDIERHSWKQAAGTSMTKNPEQERFYRCLLPRAAESGQLLSTVLYLDDRPIAHQMCLQRDSTVGVLKMSYVEDLRRYYPATVLLVGYLRDLIEYGIGSMDFMGHCEEFKMRWTSLTYGRTKCLLFRRNLRGHLAYWRHQIAVALRRGNLPEAAKTALSE